MATSGTINFSVTELDIIQEALERLGVLGEGETPNSAQITTCSRTLNMMVKAWQGEGLNLFAVQKIYIFFNPGQNSYRIQGVSGDKACTTYTSTTLKNAIATTDTYTIKVDSNANIAASDVIGIYNDGYADIEWHTVASVSSTDTVVLNEVLNGDAFAVGNLVINYKPADSAMRPVRILNGIVRNVQSNIDVPYTQINRDDYAIFPNKTTQGVPRQYYHNYQIGYAEIFTWPVPDSSVYMGVFWVQRTLDDFDATSDNPDFPQEWYLSLSTNLAIQVASKFGTDLAQIADVVTLAQDAKMLARGFDRELSVQFVPDYDN